MYFDRWAKTKPAKSGKYPPPHDHKTAAAQIFLDHGRFVRNTPKTEQNRSRTNADFLPDCFAFPSVTTAAADPQRHDSRSRSPHKTQAADSLLFFGAFNRKRAAILKPSLFQKTLHQIAQYSTQYFMQYFTIYFSICSCISGYCVVYFNQDKGKTQRQRSIT
jgi:hypothetical protein